MNLVSRDIQNILEHFEDTEAEYLPRIACADPSIVGVGSIASKALTSPLLRQQLSQRGIEPKSYTLYAAPSEFLQQLDWTMALVLSPFKQDIRGICNDLTPSAKLSGVVDTVLQDGQGRRIGVNTNALGAGWAVQHLTGGAHPGRCLIAGTGASARSCLVGLRNFYRELEIGLVGRNAERASTLAEEFSVSVVEDIETYTPDLVINATTVGETRDDKLAFSLEKALGTGVRYFDLNNRTSALQIQALERGCVTLSGILMQTVVNALRVHLLARTSQE